jgi:2',3'-cyclic-nucleotide 2'-phosphodiesterase (5'-nucleotidase family)
MRNHLFILFIAGFLSGCQPGFRPGVLQYSGYNIQRISADSALSEMLRPYSEEVRRKMLDTVGLMPVSIRKDLPDGALGNFLADSYLAMARRKFDPSVQMAFLNNGGIRINQMAAGPVLRSTIYEVMPFDNEMVILKVTGAQLQAYLDFIVAEGGGGIAGVMMTISGKKATEVQIGGKPINPQVTYVMANSDYTVFSGGFGGLKSLPVRRTGYLLRDATIDYCLDFRQRGLPIAVDIEKRISHVQ